jgi:hypothetical protein
VRVIDRRPPNYEAIAAALGHPPPNAVYAYGDAVYSPSTTDLPPDLLAHEAVHLRQQVECGGPDRWWERYLEEPAFRLEQEVEAYRVQLACFSDRASRRECLQHVVRDLAGPMYGRLVTKQQARELLAGVTAGRPDR